MSNQFQSRRLTLKILPIVTLGALGFCASTMAATSGPLVGAGGFPVLKEIVVTGTKQPSEADEKLNDEVKTAMKSDPHFFYLPTPAASKKEVCDCVGGG